jgi:hypothetical protein
MAEEIKLTSVEPNVSMVFFTYGPGGPKRGQTDFFPGETMYMTVELPKTIFPRNIFEFTCDVSLVSKTNEAQRVNKPQPARFQSFVFKEQSSFFYTYLSIPNDFYDGQYEVVVTARDRGGKVLVVEKIPVSIKAIHSYGLRNLIFMHGLPQTTYWIPGSNVFVAGETVKITFGVGGLSLNKENEVEAYVKLTLIDQEGVSLNVMDISKSSPMLNVRVSLAERDKIWPFYQEFVLAQSGSYSLKIEVKDVNAEKKENYELPLYVVDPSFACPEVLK